MPSLSKMRFGLTTILVFMGLCGWGHTALQAEVAAAPIPPGTELLSNGDFASATKDPAWPDDWKKKPWITWETGNGAHYLRFVAPEPGKDFELSRTLSLPVSQGIKALQVTVRYRTSNLKIGAKKEANARVTFDLIDAVRIKFSAPASMTLSDHAADWTVATRSFNVPAGAVTVAISFGLSQVDAGTLDLAGISVKSVPETPASVPAAATASSDVPIRREGDRTIIGYGKPSVWFINPYVDVLGHDFSLGITNLVRQAREQGHPIAVGVANDLDAVNQENEENMIYVFSYKNIRFALPAKARRMVFLNTWLTPVVQWPADRTGKKDVVLLGSKTLHNNGDGLATDKDRWQQIQKNDPSLTRTVLDSTGYYLPMPLWRTALLKIVLDEPGQGT
jgi:hypothetical protein